MGLDPKINSLWDFLDLSAHVKVPVPTLKKWHFKGKLPSIRLGSGRHGLVRFRPSDIEKWLEQQKSGGEENGR